MEELLLSEEATLEFRYYLDITKLAKIKENAGRLLVS